MIIWLASYPKSGNTWMRAFISSLFYKSEKNNSLENIKQIHAYPLTKDFYNLLDDFKNFEKIAENWRRSQDIINLENKIKFLKTHHILCRINNHSFTNYKNSLGLIYIIRDPRNVITSLMYHYSIENYDNALKFILDEKKFSGKLDLKEKFENNTEFPTYISNWKNHYNSWKNFKKNSILIKYEDLVSNPENTFGMVSDYLEKILNIKISDEKIKKAVLENSFKNLQKFEEEFGFDEAATDKLTKSKKKFFNLGPNNNWKKILPNNIKEKIEKNFEKEMKELGYL